RIRQILNNLVSNAVKFTARGEVYVEIEPVPVNEREVRVRFAVRDTGIGITPEARERLFSPFTQSDASISRRYGGTGLGLAICRQLVDLMHGTIGCESVCGEGT